MTDHSEGITREGKTVREAVESGLTALGLREQDVHVVVLREGGRGFFGLFGARSARVKIIPAVSEEERVERLVDGLMTRMGFGGRVQVSCDERRVVVRVETAGMDGLLIGRRGQTLEALEHVLERMVNRGREDRRKVTVDIGAYRKRHSGDGRRHGRSDGGGGRRRGSRNRASGRNDHLVRASGRDST
jgi:spoIIIJ-associated protein